MSSRWWELANSSCKYDLMCFHLGAAEYALCVFVVEGKVIVSHEPSAEPPKAKKDTWP